MGCLFFYCNLFGKGPDEAGDENDSDDEELVPKQARPTHHRMRPEGERLFWGPVLIFLCAHYSDGQLLRSTRKKPKLSLKTV
jgi:hypothetical protein